LAKGPTRKATKDAADRKRAALIREVRAVVFELDKHCRVCFGSRVREGIRRGTYYGPADDQMHEIESRSALRGRPPEDIFNTVNCIRLCPICHEDVTRNRLTLIPLTAGGARGIVRVTPGPNAPCRQHAQAALP
jgi:hypothetical protein